MPVVGALWYWMVPPLTLVHVSAPFATVVPSFVNDTLNATGLPLFVAVPFAVALVICGEPALLR